MVEWHIKKKYFDAILELKKPFELRHKPIEKGTIVKLVELNSCKVDCNKCEWNGYCNSKNKPTGRYIIFESGECRKLNNACVLAIFKYYVSDNHGNDMYYIFKDRIEARYPLIPENNFDWYDEFCWDYINEKQTYLIEIAKILEVM